MSQDEVSAGDAAVFMDLITQYRMDIIEEWVLLLNLKWGHQAEPKIGLLDDDRRQGKDLLSLIGMAIAGKVKNEYTHVVEKVRRPDYSEIDLLDELNCLEYAFHNALYLDSSLSNAVRFKAELRFHREAQSLLRFVLEHTAQIHEQILEKGERGFCLMDAGGRIIYANRLVNQMVDAETLVGRELASLFDDRERGLVEKAIHGNRPMLYPLRLHTGTNMGKVVGADIGPLVISGTNYGKYASMVDISEIMKLQTNVYEQSPLGIMKVNWNEQITYANPQMLRIIGADKSQSLCIEDLFQGNRANYELVKQKLKERREGANDEYEIVITRRSDGKRIPVMVAAQPEYDADRNVIGAISIIREVLADRVAEAIYRHVGQYHDGKEIMRHVAMELCRVIDFEHLSLLLYTEDLNHCRSLVTYNPQGDDIEGEQRWWELTDVKRDWLQENPKPGIFDLTSTVAGPTHRPLRDDPDIQKMLDHGVRYYTWIPVVIGKSYIDTAAVCLFARKEESFDPIALDIRDKGPITQAITQAALMALYHEQMAFRRFRLSLFKKIPEAYETMEQVAQTFINDMADYYQWDSVSIFRVDESQGFFRLLAQKAKDETNKIAENYTQPLTEGVLGMVYASKEGILIGDVSSDPRVMGRFVAKLKGTVSELCMPIEVDGKVKWLLNVEDSRRNAFAIGEKNSVEGILQEFAALLERSFLYHELHTIRETISDGIIVTDNSGRIQSANPGALSLLGYSRNQPEPLMGTPIGNYFRDPSVVENMLKDTVNKRTDEAWMKQPDGRFTDVLLSVAKLPETLGGRVFTAKDLLPYIKAERLGDIERIFQEVAGQIKTPLSLVFSWLQPLTHQEGAPPEVTEIIKKTIQQLRLVELSYDRLFLAESVDSAVPYHEILLNMSEVLDRLRQDFPESIFKSIDIHCQKSLPPVRGDLYQLSFCLMTILSYLLRFVPQDGLIRVDVTGENQRVVIEVSGFLPERRVEDLEKEPPHLTFARAVTEASLGQEIIKDFIKHHHGEFKEPQRLDGQVKYRIELPMAQEA